ncbi:MAG: MATE family efflux transporter [Pirellulales bacterium]
MNVQETDSSWWGRPSGGREVLRVSLPLVISSLSWTVMTFVDRVFLKWESGAAMAAAFSASTVWFAVVCLPLGVCTYASTFVSQYYGDRQPERIGPATWQGVWAAVCFSPLILAVIPLAPAIFRLADHGPDVLPLEIQYFQIMCFGAPGLLIAQALSSFYSGRGKTSVMMYVDGGAAVLNLVLDYLWIFGYAGFPAMGIAGAGWATVTALWVKAAIYALLVLQRQHRINFGTLAGIRLEPRLFRRLLYFGGPSGVQLLLDVLGFTVFILLVGRLGRVEAEATSMAFSISTLAFMPIWGLGLAAGILVGQRLGEDRDDLAARSTWTTLVLALAYMALMSSLYLAVPELFLFGFFAGSEETAHQAAVRPLAATLLRFVAAYNLLDAALMVFVSAIKGAGDTRFVLRVSLVMGSTLAAVSWLAVEVWQLGIYGCWAIITAWVWTLGVVFLLRFLSGNWRQMRVIERRAVVEVQAPVPMAAASPGAVAADGAVGPEAR